MEDSAIIGIISLVIFLTIVIIHFKNQKAMKLQMEKQTLLLGKMARNAGVDKDEINKILNNKRSTF